jgi:hypothetical protein
MTRSCKTCGFFVSISNSSAKNIGYCFYFDLIDIEKKESLRKQKIIDGEEKYIANGCEGYIYTVVSFK